MTNANAISMAAGTAPAAALAHTGLAHRLWARLVHRDWRAEDSLIAVLALLLLALAVWVPAFWDTENLLNLLGTHAVLGILAAGLLLVVLSGELDISFTASMTLGQYLSSWYLIHHGGNWFTVLAMSVATTTALGLLNAVLVHGLRASSVIVTIAMLNVYFGLTIYFSKGEWLYDFPDWFFEGVSLPLGAGEGAATLGLPALVLIAVWLLTAALLNWSAMGRRIYAVGGNREAAARVGMGVVQVRLFVFGYLGALAGVAAVVHAQVVQTVAPNALVGTELEVLAAVVLGGASLSGGVGSFRGMVLGVALLAVLKNALTLAGFSAYQHKFVLGLVIVLAVVLAGWRSWRQNPREFAV